MTCIIGFVDKSKRKMIIAGDRLGSNGYTGEVINKPKIFKKKKVLFGYTTSFRFGQILEHHLKIPKDKRKIPYEYIVKDLLPCIREVLETHKYSSKDDAGKSGTAIIMYKGFVYTLQDDWSVLEYLNNVSVGSGSEVASGAMLALRNSKYSNKKIAKNVIKIVSEVVLSVGGKPDVIELKF